MTVGDWSGHTMVIDLGVSLGAWTLTNVLNAFAFLSHILDPLIKTVDS